MRFVDLFCGIGGFHHALSDLNHECVFACDIDKDCNEVYFENWQMSSNGDVRNLSDVVPDHDILCAGFPCQPFSKSGQQKGLRDKMYGVTESFFPRIKGTLFGQIIDIVESRKPDFVFLENVQNLESHDNGRTIRIIRGALDELDYNVHETVLSPHHFGIPQHRPRIFIVAIKRCIDGHSEFRFPEKEDVVCDVMDIYDGSEKRDINPHLQSVLDHWTVFVSSLPDGVAPPSPTWSMEFGRDYSLDNIHPVSELSKAELCKVLSEEGISAKMSWKKDRILNLFPPYIRKMKSEMPRWKKQIILRNRKFWNDYEGIIPDDWLKTTRRFSDTHQKFEWHVGSDSEKDVMHHMIHTRPSGIRVSRMDKIPALVAIAQIPIIGPWKRRITPREAANAQSFSDGFLLHKKDSVAYKQLGNSVNVEVVRRIMQKIEIIAKCSGRYAEDDALEAIESRFQAINQ